MDILVLFLIFRGNVFSFSSLSMKLPIGLSCMAFIMLRYEHSVPNFWRVYIINGYWILSEAFSAFIEIIIWFLCFSLLMWSITLTDFQILKNPCTPRMNPTWSWCMIFLMYCWIQIANIFGGIFASVFIRDIGLKQNFLRDFSDIPCDEIFLLCTVSFWFILIIAHKTDCAMIFRLKLPPHTSEHLILTTSLICEYKLP